MKKRIFDMIVWIMTIVFISSVFFMPDTIPIHWNSQWEVDNYGSRYMMLIVASLPILIYYGILLSKKIDPKKSNFQNKEKTYDLYRYGLTVFFMMLNMLLYYMILFPQANMQISIFMIMGLLLIGLGNYMPRLPQNYFLGIKTPWTLANEMVWNKTHRIGGYSFVVMGIVLIFCGFMKSHYMMYILLGYIILEVVGIYVYSYFVYKKLQ